MKRRKALLALLLCTAMVVPSGTGISVQAAKADKKAAVKAAAEISEMERAEKTEEKSAVKALEEENRPLSPQMGWSTWNFFREQVDESKIKDAANAMVTSGLKDAGYVYLNVDDCWQSSMRDPETGSMMFDLDNFPSGPDLVNQLHEMGLKVGLYSSSGELTCEDLPGSYGLEAIDAKAFAKWGVDYLKYDYCHVVDLPTDPEGGTNFSGFTTSPEVDYISLAPYTGTDGVSGENVKLEAEADGVERTGNVTVQNNSRCSGGKYVTGIGKDSAVIFKNVNAPEDGKYLLTIGYRKTRSERGRYAEVLVNDSNRYEAHVARSSGWSGTGRHQIVVDLKAGENTIKLHNPITGQKDDSVRRYTNMGLALQNATAEVAKENGTQEKPIFFSICEHGRSGPWNWAAGIGNSWRTSGDISANWNSVVSCYESSISHWDKQVPGSYNDPDMMQVGNGSLTDLENQTHFTLWSMLSAPLILGNDVRNFAAGSGNLSEKDQKVYDIVTNKEIIALNQDLPLLQCKRISTANGMDILVKPLQNQETGEAEVAVCFFNKTGGNNSSASVDLKELAAQDARLADLGWDGTELYRAKNLWTDEEALTGNTLTSGNIASHGVEVYRISAAKAGDVEKLVSVSVNAKEIYAANEEGVVEVEVSNMGTTDVENLVVSLDGKDEIAVKEAVSESINLKANETATITFHITPPVMKATDRDAYLDSYTLSTETTFNYKGESDTQTKTSNIGISVSQPVGTGTEEVKLGDAPWLLSTTGWAGHPTKRNKTIENRTISIVGTEYTSGIGAHASSDTQIFVGGQDCTFTSVVGIDDEVAGYQPQWAPSVTFIILADGKEVYRTEELVFGDSEEISLEIKDCQVLTLRADMGESNSSDHVGWGDATLTFGEKEEKPEDKEIASVEEPEGKTVYATPMEELELPEEVTVVLKDGRIVNAQVTEWECENYDPMTEGVYVFTGILAVSEEYANPENKVVQIQVEVKVPDVNIAPLAKATAPDGASATQGNVTKQPGWVNDGIYDDQGRPNKDGVYAFATPLSDKSYFDLTWEKAMEVDRIVLNTYFADEQGPTSYEVLVQHEGSDTWESVGSKADIKWPVHDGRTQYQSEIVFEQALENVKAMRVLVTKTNAMWGVSVVTEFEVYGGEMSEAPIAADKEELEALIAYAKEQKEAAEYQWVVKTVKDLFEEALEGAIKVKEDTTATEKEVSEAYDLLLSRVHLLGFTGNPTDLASAVAIAKATSTEGKTEESVAILNAAIAKAEAMIAGEDTLQEDLDAMVEELTAAIEGLEDKEEVNKEKLLKLINKAENYDLSKYTELTADGLKAALEGAKAVYGNTAAVQEEVDSAYSSLQQAIFNLRKIPDKSELEELLGNVKTMDLSAYSAEAVSAVKAAIAVAEEVMADGNADQTKVDAAVKALQDAVEAAHAEDGSEDGKNPSANDSDVSDGSNASDQKEEESEDKVASDNTGNESEINIKTKTASNTAAKTGDAANAAVPVAVGLAAVLGVLAAWKKK